MKKLFYTASAAILATTSILLTSSTRADETSNEFKYASSIEYFYRVASINSFKDYRDVKKEAEAAKKAEEKKVAEEAAKKAEEEKKAAEEAAKKEAEAAKKAEEEKKAAEEQKKAAEEKKAEESSAVQTSTERLYSLSDFMFRGVVYWNDYKFTYYSQSVLPGGGLSIPGRHVNADGYVSDGDGYIVLAGSAPKGTVYDTPFGYKGKIYDRGTSGNHLDVYVQ